MENKEWNRNEWQGKRKDQVMYTRTVSVIGVVSIIVILLIFGICQLCGIK
jgi:uncharacterized membrane protein YidH (DUF202 family)